MAAVELAKALSDKLGIALDETLLWNFATINDLLDHLQAESHVGAPSSQQLASSTEARAATSAPKAVSDGALDDELDRLELELKRR
jgi:hypothetical protein